MESVLASIVANKRTELLSLPVLKPKRRRGTSFIEAILGTRPSLIAEIKPVSPSKGSLLDRKDVPTLVELYNRHAQAISVLCDRKFFGGGFDLLAEVRTLTHLPLLAKEFILSPAQIDHAVSNGASAILLIVSILSHRELIHLAEYAVACGLDVLVEAHKEGDVEKLASAFGEMSADVRHHLLVGINNRNLERLTTDIRTTEHLVPLVKSLMPECRGIIAESGIDSGSDTERLGQIVDGFLIGTSILQSDDLDQFILSLIPLSQS